MKQKYQVTLFCADKKFRPISCLIEVEQMQDVDLTKDKRSKKEIELTGVRKICIQKCWSKSDLLKYNFTRVKVRLYDKEKVDAEKKERYEKIKQAKYASGEWKKPKK